MEVSYFTILYWFCHTLTWIRHRYTRVPHLECPSLLPPHTIPLGPLNAPAPSIQYHASNLDWQFVSYMMSYIPIAGHTHLGNQNWKRRVPQCSSQHCLDSFKGLTPVVEVGQVSFPHVWQVMCLQLLEFVRRVSKIEMIYLLLTSFTPRLDFSFILG